MGSQLAIGLAWHTSNSGNLGIGALSAGHVSLIRSVTAATAIQPTFTLFSARQREADYLNEFDSRIDLTNRALLSPNASFRSVSRQDCLLDVGEGDGFSDIYGLKRLFRHAALNVQAHLAGVPYVLAPQTIGPFSTSVGRSVARWVIRHASAVTVRDELSAAVAADLVPGCRPLLATDLAFAMAAAPVATMPSDRIRVGINPSGLLSAEGKMVGNIRLHLDHRALIDALLQRLAGRKDLELHLFGHVRGTDPVDNDCLALDQFSKRFPGVTRVPAFDSPADAKSWISGMDVVIAARMHACIAAFSAGVPVVPLSYSRKFEGLFQGLGWGWLVPHQGMEQEQALELIEAAIAGRLRLRQEMVAGRTEAQRRLDVYRDFLHDFLSSIAARKEGTRR